MAGRVAEAVAAAAAAARAVRGLAARKGRVEQPAERLVAAGVAEGVAGAAAAGVAVAVAARLAARVHPPPRPLKEDAGSNAEWPMALIQMVVCDKQVSSSLSEYSLVSPVCRHAPTGRFISVLRHGHLVAARR